jgi:hypothetical protein
MVFYLKTSSDYLGNTVMWMSRFVGDYIRFILANKTVLKIAPLQVYASRALFGPRNSPVRRLFEEDEPKRVLSKLAVEADWSSCLHKLESSKSGNAIAFSADDLLLAAGATDGTIMIPS